MSAPTVRSANLLLLVTALLVQTVGGVMQFYSLTWGLILTEVLLILAPVLLLLRRRHLPLADTLALRWPGLRPVVLAGLTGLGTVALSAWLAKLGHDLLGYVPSSQLGSAETGLALVLAVAVFAPLCEEAFFRGYLFKAYLERGAKFAVPATALLFALFHMRFADLPALLPTCFALSFVRGRSDSLLPGIALHMVHNAMCVAPDQLWALTYHSYSLTQGIVGVCALIGAVAFVAFARTVLRPPGVPAAVPEEIEELGPSVQPQPRFWPQAWPVVVFGLIYIASSALEVLLSTGRMTLAG